MTLIIIFVVSFVTGLFASLGLGGGMILILYLTMIGSVGQLEAQGICLLFFLPIAVLSLVFHTKNKLVEWKKALPCLIVGSVTSLVFAYIATLIDTNLLSRLFGGFIVLTGVCMLVRRK